MNKFVITFIVIFILTIFYIFLVRINKNEIINKQIKKGQIIDSKTRTPTLTNISDFELKKMLIKKDFKLVDVHIPEQRHILKTDYFIPYNQLDEFIKTFPDKNEKIVLYCRSGGMSTSLARELVKRGYSNIYNLVGGVRTWLANGGKVTSIIK